jgi:protease-4
MVLALILIVLLGFSMLLNMSQFFSGLTHGHTAAKHGSRGGGPRLNEVTVEDNDATDKVALIEVEGIITGRTKDQGGYNLIELVRAQLERARTDKDVKAVLLKVDSPGGEVLASDEINRAIVEFQRDCNKPVVASMGSLAASGGYYVSAPCRWIVANDLTITGSIGVIMSTYNYRGLMDKVGLVPVTFKSGKFKDMLSGSREPDSITQEEKDMIQSLINETFGKFKTVVRDGRTHAYEANKKAADQGRALDAHWENYADGRVLSGTEALKLGFVDELGNFQDAFKRTRMMAGVKKANLVQYQQRYDLADFFKMFGSTDAKAVKIDLGVEAPKLQAGQLYFLAPNFVH